MYLPVSTVFTKSVMKSILISKNCPNLKGLLQILLKH